MFTSVKIKSVDKFTSIDNITSVVEYDWNTKEPVEHKDLSKIVFNENNYYVFKGKNTFHISGNLIECVLFQS